MGDAAVVYYSPEMASRKSLEPFTKGTKVAGL
jgi:hypothetical protein